MKFNFKQVLNHVLGTGDKVVGDFSGENGRIARSLTQGASNRQYERSLRARSENFTMQFPVVVSDSLSMDTVEVLRNQVEIERSVDISTVISNSPAVSTIGDNDYLKNYHNNLYLGNNSPLSTRNESASAFKEANENLLTLAEDILETKSLNTTTLPPELVYVQEDDDALPAKAYDKVPVDGAKVSKADRMNRTIPLMSRVSAKFAVKDPNDSYKVVSVENKELTFGVKAVVHMVSNQDIIYFLSDSSKRSNILARLIKLTTGEISFFREFLLNVDRSKKIALSKQPGVWNTMNSMFTVEKINQYRNKKTGMIPTITLVISLEEVEAIRVATGIDILSNKNAAAKIFDELFLLDFYVVDEANQIAHKYLPRERGFEPHTLSAMSGRDLNDRNKANNSAESLLKRLLSNK